MKPVFIYALLDPRNMVMRYCGQTEDPDKRLSTHCRTTQKQATHAGHWIAELIIKGLKPIMEILDVVPDSEADFWETEYIQNFRERGFDLTNFSDGGEAPMRGKKHSPEACAKMSASRAGIKLTPEHCLAISIGLTGLKHTPERRAHQCAVMSGQKHHGYGKKQSAETCLKRSFSLTGEKNPMYESLALFGKKHKTNTSGFVGVSYHKVTGKWQSGFTIKQKTFHVGIFLKIEDAIFARALAVAIHFSS